MRLRRAAALAALLVAGCAPATDPAPPVDQRTTPPSPTAGHGAPAVLRPGGGPLTVSYGPDKHAAYEVHRIEYAASVPGYQPPERDTVYAFADMTVTNTGLLDLEAVTPGTSWRGADGRRWEAPGGGVQTIIERDGYDPLPMSLGPSEWARGWAAYRVPAEPGSIVIPSVEEVTIPLRPEVTR